LRSKAINPVSPGSVEEMLGAPVASTEPFQRKGSQKGQPGGCRSVVWGEAKGGVRSAVVFVGEDAQLSEKVAVSHHGWSWGHYPGAGEVEQALDSGGEECFGATLGDSGRDSEDAG